MMKFSLFYFFEKIILMQSIIKALQARLSWKESLRKCCRINKLNIQIASYYTPLRFRASYSKFKAIYERKSQDKIERWIENQLKAFYWMCATVSCVKQVKISEFHQGQWQIINDIFYFKQPLTLEYEGRKLVEDVTTKKNWNQQQDDLLGKIVQQSEQISNKWNDFARKLFERSEKIFFRTGKQCRQRWLNHLDPTKKHGEWTNQEDKKIVQFFLSDGNKWSQIARKLGNQRTQHMVKNRYKTIILKQKKEYPHIQNENVLMKSFLDPSAADKYRRRQRQRVEEPSSGMVVKVEHKSQEVQLPPELKDEEQLVKEDESEERPIDHSDKNLPQTSCAFQLPQVYSPWYVNIPITPTFSPSVSFFVNLTSFSAFDANYSNQFYCPRKTSDKIDKNQFNSA